jgi:hypothetical protein
MQGEPFQWLVADKAGRQEHLLSARRSIADTTASGYLPSMAVPHLAEDRFPRDHVQIVRFEPDRKFDSVLGGRGSTAAKVVPKAPHRMSFAMHLFPVADFSHGSLRHSKSQSQVQLRGLDGKQTGGDRGDDKTPL